MRTLMIALAALALSQTPLLANACDCGKDCAEKCQHQKSGECNCKDCKGKNDGQCAKCSKKHNGKKGCSHGQHGEKQAQPEQNKE